MPWTLRAPPVPECPAPRYLARATADGIVVVPSQVEARKFSEPADAFQFMREHPAVEGWTLVRIT